MVNELKVGEATVYYTMPLRVWRQVQKDIADGKSDDAISQAYLPDAIVRMTGVTGPDGAPVERIESPEALNDLDARFVNRLWIALIADVSGADAAAPFLRLAPGGGTPLGSTPLG